MSTAYVVVTLVTAAALTFSAAADHFLRERVLANMDRAGVPHQLAARAGCPQSHRCARPLAGLAFRPLGIAAVGLVLCFAGAIIAHLRARWYDISYPSIYLVLGATTLALGLAA
jgi:hypothetical protein